MQLKNKFVGLFYRIRENQKWSMFLTMIFLVVLFGITHLPRLGSDEINPDAVNWHQRSEQYIDAIKSRDFERTYQHYHPGVTLMVIMGFPIEVAKRITQATYDKSTYELFHTVAKYSLNFVLLLLTIYLVLNLSKIFGFVVSYSVGLLLTLDPFFLGNARILHMDALLSMFVMNALVLMYLAYHKKSVRNLILGSVFLGLSFWTKNVALIPIAYSICFLIGLAVVKKVAPIFSAKGILLIVLNFVLVGVFVLPALWVNPNRVITKMYGGSKTVVDEGHEQKFFGVKTDDPGFFYYPLVLAYKLSPQVLIGFLISIVWLAILIFRDGKGVLNSKNLPLYYFLLYFVCYFTAFSISSKKIDRYMLPLFPVIYLFVSYFFIRIYRSASNPRKAISLLTLTILTLHPLIAYFPYYFVYNSPLLGGNPSAEKTIGQKSFGIAVFEVRDFILNNYGNVKVGLIDRKPIAQIYPNSMVFDARVIGPHNYDVLVLDSDDDAPKKTQGKFVYSKSIKIAGVNYWNFYVKSTQSE